MARLSDDGTLTIGERIMLDIGALATTDVRTAFCGVMSIVPEDFSHHFSRPVSAQMPAMPGGFTRKKQNELEAFLSRRSGRTIQRRS